MQCRRAIPSTVILFLAIVLTACAPAAAPTMEAAPAPTMALDAYSGAAEAPAAAPAATAAAPMPQSGPEVAAPSFLQTDHLIIKNADMKLLVADTPRALDGVTQVVSDVRGYMLSSRVWYQDYFGTSYMYATLTLGVPVDQFEIALKRVRGLSLRVLEDNSSGEDVSSQYVDLQSELTNLQATRDRIKGFLDQATSVDEALRINQQLSDVEVQIEKIQGQMNYLSNRSAFSTITINLEPDLPPVVATPTPTATPEAIQPLAPWDPNATTQRATNALVTVYRSIVELLIWVFVVLVPIFGPPALAIWLVVWLVRRRAKPAQRA